MQKILQLIGGGGVQGLSLPETFLRAFNDLFARQALNSGVLVAGTVTTKLKITNQINIVNNGVLSVVAASDGTATWVESASSALPAYALSATQVGGYVFTVDAGGLFHALVFTPSASLASAPGFPTIPVSHVVFGLALINTSNAASFAANTTALSAANVQLVNQAGPFSPTNAF